MQILQALHISKGKQKIIKRNIKKKNRTGIPGFEQYEFIKETIDLNKCYLVFRVSFDTTVPNESYHF